MELTFAERYGGEEECHCQGEDSTAGRAHAAGKTPADDRTAVAVAVVASAVAVRTVGGSGGTVNGSHPGQLKELFYSVRVDLLSVFPLSVF